MAASPALVEAVIAFVSEVAPEAVLGVCADIEAGDVAAAERRMFGDAASHFAKVRAAWNRCPVRPTYRELAALLLGAWHGVERERRRQSVALVWSGPVGAAFALRSSQPALLELIAGAEASLYLVTFAAYKVPAIAEALLRAARRGVRVVLVVEDVASSDGRIAFDPLPHLMATPHAGIEVFIWPWDQRLRDGTGRHGTLHAKFAVADRHRLLVSSANMTESAFELNIEMGVLVEGGSAPRQAVEVLERMVWSKVLQPVVAG